MRSSEEVFLEPHSELRIVGGAFAKPGQAPHHASLRYKYFNFHFCGGSIIGSQWILTAAHCLHGMQNKNIEVVVGTNSLSKGGQHYDVERIIPHEAYMETVIQYDIGLVKLAKEIIFSEVVQLIGLSEEYTAANRLTRVYGFGLTNVRNIP